MKVEMEVLGSVLRAGDLYLDPGSGSFLVQILIAGLLGSAFAIKMYWKKIKSIFIKTPPTDASVDEDDNDID